MEKVLEVCVDSLASALAAERGGATRLELAAHLMIGGVTPEEDLYRQIAARVHIPIRVMIRPRCGDFCYSDSEFELMASSVRRFAALQPDGLVFGILTPDGNLDVPRMEQLIAQAGDCGITLHRAFDVARDAMQVLAEARQLGIDTILTSGQAANCVKGAPLLRELMAAAGEDIQIMVGAGVNADVIRQLQLVLHATAYHMSGKRLVDSRMEFRRQDIPMGLPGLSEFTIWQCDEKAVRAARNALFGQ